MTGAAFAAAYQAGVLDLFFHGDTGSLEPYVQMTIPSTENEDYRLTVDSSLYDGQNLYLVMTVEALNEQAVSDLGFQQLASPYSLCWDFTALSSDSSDPAHSMGVQELPARTDTSLSLIHILPPISGNFIKSTTTRPWRNDFFPRGAFFDAGADERKSLGDEGGPFPS